MTPWAPKSGEQDDQTAPILATPKKLITVSGIFGKIAHTLSPL